MLQKQPVEPAEAGAATEQLTLSALPAIDQDPMSTNFHEKARMIALRRWHAGRSSEKGQTEHGWGNDLLRWHGRGETMLANYISDEHASPIFLLKKPLIIFLMLVFVPIAFSAARYLCLGEDREIGGPQTGRAPACCRSRHQSTTP